MQCFGQYSDLPIVLNILRGRVVRAYILRSREHTFCIFGHSYPHLHLIIYNEHQKDHITTQILREIMGEKVFE